MYSKTVRSGSFFLALILLFFSFSQMVYAGKIVFKRYKVISEDQGAAELSHQEAVTITPSNVEFIPAEIEADNISVDFFKKITKVTIFSSEKKSNIKWGDPRGEKLSEIIEKLFNIVKRGEIGSITTKDLTSSIENLLNKATSITNDLDCEGKKPNTINVLIGTTSTNPVEPKEAVVSYLPYEQNVYARISEPLSSEADNNSYTLIGIEYTYDSGKIVDLVADEGTVAGKSVVEKFCQSVVRMSCCSHRKRETHEDVLQLIGTNTSLIKTRYTFSSILSPTSGK